MHSQQFARPMIVAVASSIAGHLVFIGMFVWLIARVLQPSPTERVLVLKFSPSEQDAPTDLAAATEAATSRHADIGKARAPDQNGLRNRQPTSSNPDVARAAQAEEEKQRENVAPTSSLPARAQAALPSPAAQSDTRSPKEVAKDSSAEMPGTGAVVVTSAIRTDSVKKPKSAVVEVNKAEDKMLRGQLRRWQKRFGKSNWRGEPLRWQHKGQPYEARFSKFPARGDMDIDKLAVEVLTEKDGKLLRTEMQMQMLAFSHFAQFVNRWDRRVQLHDDTLDGRFHSNSRVNLAWDRHVQPRFLGKVTTSARSFNYNDARGMLRREQIFLGGLETGVRNIPMARRFQPLPGAATELPAQVIKFAADTHIRFYADGTVGWEDEANANERREKLGDGSTYLVADKGATLHVSGIVNGQALVYSPTRIVIVDDLTYAHRGSAGDARDSFLGLVSGKNIEIAEPEITGPGPLYIHAAMYAQGQFKVRDYLRREQSHLYIYGSLTAGSLSATEPRFSTHIEFDQRLKNRRPPGYPMTGQYELMAWNGQWHETQKTGDTR